MEKEKERDESGLDLQRLARGKKGGADLREKEGSLKSVLSPPKGEDVDRRKKKGRRGRGEPRLSIASRNLRGEGKRKASSSSLT